MKSAVLVLVVGLTSASKVEQCQAALWDANCDWDWTCARLCECYEGNVLCAGQDLTTCVHSLHPDECTYQHPEHPCATRTHVRECPKEKAAKKTTTKPPKKTTTKAKTTTTTKKTTTTTRTTTTTTKTTTKTTTTTKPTTRGTTTTKATTKGTATSPKTTTKATGTSGKTSTTTKAASTTATTTGTGTTGKTTTTTTTVTTTTTTATTTTKPTTTRATTKTTTTRTPATPKVTTPLVTTDRTAWVLHYNIETCQVSVVEKLAGYQGFCSKQCEYLATAPQHFCPEAAWANSQALIDCVVKEYYPEICQQVYGPQLTTKSPGTTVQDHIKYCEEHVMSLQGGPGHKYCREKCAYLASGLCDDLSADGLLACMLQYYASKCQVLDVAGN